MKYELISNLDLIVSINGIPSYIYTPLRRHRFSSQLNTVERDLNLKTDVGLQYHLQNSLLVNSNDYSQEYYFRENEQLNTKIRTLSSYSAFYQEITIISEKNDTCKEIGFIFQKLCFGTYELFQKLLEENLLSPIVTDMFRYNSFKDQPNIMKPTAYELIIETSDIISNTSDARVLIDLINSQIFHRNLYTIMFPGYYLENIKDTKWIMEILPFFDKCYVLIDESSKKSKVIILKKSNTVV